MNKLLKYLLVGLAVVSVSIACTKAENVEDLIVYSAEIENFNYSTSYKDITKLNGEHTLGTICVKFTKVSGNDNNMLFGFTTTSNGTPSRAYSYYNFGQYICGDYYLDGYLVTKNSSSLVVDIDVFVLNTLLQTTIPVMTSLECQTEYNLIPISEVTANYCKLNFDLIDPMECPINSGTGAIVRSNLTINDTPYAQNQNINVFIPDFLAWNISFNDFTTAIEVEGYNADEDYINNVIDQEKLTPTNQDFANMLVGLANFFPYLAIALLFYFLIKVVYKTFK